MKKTISTTALVTLLLSACGDPASNSAPDLGAAEGEAHSATPYTAYASGSGNDNSEPPPTQTSRLRVDDGFLFDASGNVSFTVDVIEARGKDSYLSLCAEFEPVGDSYKVNYDSCLVKASMSNGRFDADLLLPNQYDELIGVIWPSAPGDGPIYVEIELPESAI